MIDAISSLIGDGIDLIRLALVLGAIVVVAQVFFRTRALVPVVAAVFLAALVLVGTSDFGLDWFTDRISDDADRYGAGIDPVSHI